MENCLVTKLKSEVHNNELLKVGELRFRVVNSNNSSVLPFWLGASSPFDVNIIGNGHLYQGTLDNQQNVTTSLSNVTTTIDYRLSPGDYYVSICSKYGLSRLILNSTPLPDCNIYMNIDDLAYSEGLMHINLVGSADNEWNVVGDIDSLKSGCEHVIKYSKLTGTTAKYGTLSFIKNSAQVNVIPSKYITGTLEALVENLNAVNYDSTIKFDIFADNKLTLHGNLVAITYFVLIVDASGNTVIKDYGNNTLATYTKSTGTWTYNS